MKNELMLTSLDLKLINQTWTLFLDRDGVVNHDKVGSYIFNADEFIFYDAVPEAFKLFKEKFGRIIITTNQRGVGRGLMTEHDLKTIHQKMKKGIEQAGGRIDAIYYAISTNNDDPLRKPNPGMALRAKEHFSEIDFCRSIMIGNNISDMEFGRNTGMHTVFLTTTQPDLALPHPAIDMVFNSLPDFAKAL